MHQLKSSGGEIGASNWSCHITVDFATAASQNSVCLTQQMCHIMTLFHECSYEKVIINLMLNNIGLLMKEKLEILFF
jgi:hypothetical protein